MIAPSRTKFKTVLHAKPMKGHLMARLSHHGHFRKNPWPRLHVFGGPFLGDYFLVMIEAFSKQVEVQPVPSPPLYSGLPSPNMACLTSYSQTTIYKHTVCKHFAAKWYRPHAGASISSCFKWSSRACGAGY